MSEMAARFREEQRDSLPGILGFDWLDARVGYVKARLEVAKLHLAPTGYLHAATIVALADTACGFGCRASLPESATGFATAELKAKFIGTARQGGVVCEAHLMHAGRTTQLWDAEMKGGDRRQDYCSVSMHANSALLAPITRSRAFMIV